MKKKYFHTLGLVFASLLGSAGIVMSLVGANG